jgi:hypothetical protein
MYGLCYNHVGGLIAASFEGGLFVSGESDYSGTGTSRVIYTSFQWKRGGRGPSPREGSGFEVLRILFSAAHAHSAGADIPGAVAPCGPGCHLRVNGEQRSIR